MVYASKRRLTASLTVVAFLSVFAVARSLPAEAPPANQGQLSSSPPFVVDVSQGTQRLEMTVQTSRILTLMHDIPRAQVNNPDILSLQALEPNKIQLFAKKAGVTQVNLWDKKGNIQSIDVIVFNDARELAMLLQSQFPSSSLQVTPLPDSVAIKGFVERPDEASKIIQFAQVYYPKVLNNITVGGVQQVKLHVKVMEVSRTKLRTMGFDFATTNGNDFLVSSISGLISPASASAGIAAGAGDTVRFGIVDGNNRFFGFLEALRKDNLMKILAEPTVVTISGRAASFKVGGEIPILVPQSLGTVSIEYKNYGTQVDVVPIVLGNGRIRLEVRPRVSELDDTRGVVINNIIVPGIRIREVDTGVEMRSGQTMALGGLVQNRVEADTKGLPYLSEMPYFGAPFRRVSEKINEIELLIMVTPELVSPMEAYEVPPCGPGMNTASPRDCDLYWRGHIEVPSCGPCGIGNGQGNCPAPGQRGPAPEEVGPGEQAKRPVQPRQAALPGSVTPVPGMRGSYNTGTPPRQPTAQSQGQRGPAPQDGVRQQGVPAAPPGLIGPFGYDVK
ncbi:MAG: pilus assembly protein N-terminal domain-containing protein [Planctomycetes bacterium]|nr:pilus assembly protein N-terminal domain-containing protein [Planctomycetota bacterium]